MSGRGVRSAVTAVALSSIVGLSACGSHGPASGAGQGAPTSTQPPLSAGPPDESEVSPGFDESPDGPAPTLDADLSDAALEALLRTRGSSSGLDQACRPGDVTARLSGFDVGMGHRYTWLVVTNSSARPCFVDGVPGIGARGEWGHRFTLSVERGASSSRSPGPVRLAPGGEAQAQLEWTGELAGHDSERASLLVVQLTAGQVPVSLAADLVGVPGEQGSLDIGMFTTIRLGSFERRS